jgi:hypothetical protein
MRALSFALAVAALACQATTPDGYPVVTGEYSSTQLYQAEFTSVPSGTRTSGVGCGGYLTISAQRGGTLEGHYSRGRPCVLISGPLTGAVERDGRVTLNLLDASGFQSFTDCRFLAGQDRWSGEIREDRLVVRIDVLLDCGQPEPLQTRGTLSGIRTPGSR